jgi:hypothetical protein
LRLCVRLNYLYSLVSLLSPLLFLSLLSLLSLSLLLVVEVLFDVHEEDNSVYQSNDENEMNVLLDEFLLEEREGSPAESFARRKKRETHVTIDPIIRYVVKILFSF